MPPKSSSKRPAARPAAQKSAGKAVKTINREVAVINRQPSARPVAKPVVVSSVPAVKKPVPAPALAPAPEEVVAQRALVITEEAAKHATAILRLKVPDLSIEQAVVSFRNEVIKPGMAEAHRLLDPSVVSAQQTLNVARQPRDLALEPFEKADRQILDALNGYESLKKRIHLEEVRKAEQEQAERERQAALQRDEEKKRIAALVEQQLDELAEKGLDDDDELVNKITAQLEEFSEPVALAPPVQVSAPPSTGSIIQQSSWKGTVIDAYLLLKEILEKRLPMTLIEWRQSELNSLARVYKDKQTAPPGLKFYDEPFVRGSGRH